LNILDEAIVKKWTSVRDIYMVNKRKYNLALASGAPATEEPKWKWWSFMKWYSDFTKRKLNV